MIPSAKRLFGDSEFLFQHTKTTTAWFADHQINVISWPANSSDLNPIENLWGIVERKMTSLHPSNQAELKAAVETTWTSITTEQCHLLVSSMPRRIQVVRSKRSTN
ncbi:hypothetical protein LDENG_00086210 [Lucifuga dentata]|nr:hypothetical protein LDENG_00086210 [Lucifuga dentata]